jgi:uncharacterized YigZ family protein
MQSEYYTVENAVSYELIINKSRFISECFHVLSEEDAMKEINKVRQKYPDASHHCYAYMVKGEATIYRFNDDGEPGGTAGMPILQVIQQKEINNVLVVVTRYFGGIKLGAGGLVRAYSRAASEVLQRAQRVKMVLCNQGMIEVEYHLLGVLEYFLKQRGIPILDIDYQEKVCFSVITNEKWENFTTSVQDICNGRAVCKMIKSAFHPWKET